jgi:hypothetical protein
MQIKDLSVELDAKAMTEVAGGGDINSVQANESYQFAGGAKSLTAQYGVGNANLTIAANSQSSQQANVADLKNIDLFKKTEITTTVVDLF